MSLYFFVLPKSFKRSDFQPAMLTETYHCSKWKSDSPLNRNEHYSKGSWNHHLVLHHLHVTSSWLSAGNVSNSMGRIFPDASHVSLCFWAYPTSSHWNICIIPREMVVERHKSRSSHNLPLNWDGKKSNSSNLIDILTFIIFSNKKSLLLKSTGKTQQGSHATVATIASRRNPNPKAWKLVPLARIRSKKWYDKGVTSRDNNVAHHNKPQVTSWFSDFGFLFHVLTEMFLWMICGECTVDAYTGGVLHVEIVSKIRFTHTHTHTHTRTHVTSSTTENNS